jgi:hypothetical protein
MTDKEQDSEKSEAASGADRDPDEASTDESSTPPERTAEKVTKKPDTDSPEAESRSRPSRQVSMSVRGLLTLALIVALVAGVAVMTWLYVGARHEISEQQQSQANSARAEQIALDYATNAAQMNFQDLAGWKSKLVAGTGTELSNRLAKAADQMEQILVPLQWTSTARPLAAKVRSNVGTVYTVDAFVSVLTKTVQGPDPLQSTATYSVTVDSGQDWKITDVGGIGAAVGAR